VLKTIYSVGHSSHDWSTFIRLLDAASIGVVIDVRSNPASRLPHFNRTALKERLNAVGIRYVFLGLELGGRVREGGVPDHEQMATSRMFAEGLNGVEEMAARTRPALMCSEHEPLTCHRCLLVGRRLAERGNDVAHILRDGRIETNTTTEERLLALTRQSDADLFAPRSERIAAAYRNQALRITKVAVARNRGRRS
jgi:uncharacterized protein (DUF488 family)